MPAHKSELSRFDRIGYFASNVILRGLISLVLILPYETRLHFMGWLSAKLVSPIARYPRRIRTNLKLARPDLTKDEVEKLVHDVPDNAGRTLIEHFSAKGFKKRAEAAEITGPGWQPLLDARASGRPVILLASHFGNYLAARAKLFSKGHEMGALYRRMANPYFNDYYTAALAGFGEPIFEQGRRGMVELVRHLRQGGTLGILVDLHAHQGSELTFFGQPAVTSLITAEMAVKYDCLVVPVYAVRRENGLDFDIEFHAPIPHSDPETMTQAMNDNLEAMVRQHMGQWFWIHRRWKPWGGLGIQPDIVD